MIERYKNIRLKTKKNNGKIQILKKFGPLFYWKTIISSSNLKYLGYEYQKLIKSNDINN